MNVATPATVCRAKQNQSKHGLSRQRRHLVEEMQRFYFGRFERLIIRDGDPDWELPPTIIREVKFGGENGPRPQVCTDDYLLKSQVVEMFDHFDYLQNGTITVLEVKHGLPFRMLIAESDN